MALGATRIYIGHSHGHLVTIGSPHPAATIIQQMVVAICSPELRLDSLSATLHSGLRTLVLESIRCRAAIKADDNSSSCEFG